MEIPVGGAGAGDGLRPTINSYVYGDSMAISKLSAMAGDDAGAAQYASKAEAVKQAMERYLWDGENYIVRLTSAGFPLRTGVVEEIGLVPWYFNIPDGDKSSAWKYLMDPDFLYAEYGPLTAQRSHSGFREGTQYGSGTCQWNGPSWPFATTQTLVGMANLLNNYEQDVVGREDYFDILSIYAKSHFKANSADGARHSWLAEDLNGLNGRWIADEARSVNYNHSAFNDMVITGLIGLRPSEGEDITVNPLLPDGEWDYFCLENVPYHGKSVTIMYDRDGTKYGAESGFSVYVDGVLEANSPIPEKTVIRGKTLNAAPSVAFKSGGEPIASIADASGRRVEADVTLPSGIGECSVILALYRDGRLIGMEAGDASGGAGGSPHSIGIPADCAGLVLKAFIWDAGFAPAMPASTLD
jgi:hypothetical protein